jgi:L-amino acid N-acyltransferase YncA
VPAAETIDNSTTDNTEKTTTADSEDTEMMGLSESPQSFLIRPACDRDFDGMWDIFHAVVQGGDTYVFAPHTPPEVAREYFLGDGVRSWVAEDDGRIVGMYKLIPNRCDLGSHVANASFMVHPGVHGRGIGRALGEHCLEEARKAGYEAMQFNFVVSTNTAGVALWQKLGFNIVGTLPRVFKHAQLGLVDAYVMHRFLSGILAVSGLMLT